MTKFFKFVLLTSGCVLIIALAGCSSRNFPLLYRQPILQGNRITAERIEQVKVGMSRQQVHYLLGSPSFIDTFHQDRWDYFFILDQIRREPVHHSMILYFEGDSLVRIDGEPAQGDRISDLLKS